MSESNCSNETAEVNKPKTKLSPAKRRILPGIIIGLATIVALAGIILGVFGDTPEGQFWPTGFKLPGK
jgi:hypothetical protein